MNDYRARETDRRLHNVVMIGCVSQVDLAHARARVSIGEFETAMLPWLAPRAGQDAVWWPLEVGEQVIVLSPGGDPAQGWIIPAGYTAAHPAPAQDADVHAVAYKDGAVVSYDRKAHKLSAVLPSGATAELVADGGVTVTGPVTIDGDVTVTGKVAADGDVAAGSISLQQHVHGGVQAGGARTGGPQ